MLVKNHNMSPKVKLRSQRRYSMGGNLGAQAIAFWLRRSMDGTSEDFQEGLRKLLTAYDREFLTAMADTPR